MRLNDPQVLFTLVLPPPMCIKWAQYAWIKDHISTIFLLLIFLVHFYYISTMKRKEVQLRLESQPVYHTHHHSPSFWSSSSYSFWNKIPENWKKGTATCLDWCVFEAQINMKMLGNTRGCLSQSHQTPSAAQSWNFHFNPSLLGRPLGCCLSSSLLSLSDLPLFFLFFPWPALFISVMNADLLSPPGSIFPLFLRRALWIICSPSRWCRCHRRC